MKKVLIGIGILVVLVIAAVAIFAATFDVNRYHDRIQSMLEQQLNRKVTLGEMHLGLFPPTFRLQSLSIAEDPKVPSQSPFVQAQELEVSVKLLPLLSKSVEINSISLQQPKVELIKDRQGEWNFASLGNKSQPSSSSGSSGQLSLSELLIKDGQVALTDLQKGTPRSVYDHIDLTLHDFAPKQPFSLELAAHLPGPGSQEIQLQGQGGPIADQPASTPFQGTLSLKQVTIAGFRQFVDSAALAGTDGSLSGQTKINSASGKLSAAGQIIADNVKVHGTDLGYPISMDYDVSDDLPNDMLTLRNTTLKLGTTPLLINGTVNTAGATPKLDLALRATNVSIAEATRLAAASGVAFSPGVAINGTVSADIRAQGPADAPALTGTVNGRDIQASGKELAQPVQVKTVNLTLTPADVRSDNFTVTSGATAVAVQFALKQYMAKSPTVDATVRAPNAALPALLAMAKAYGVTALDPVSGQGTLSMDLHAAGPVSSIASSQVAKALNGTLKLNFNNVVYKGTNINHQLASIGGFLKQSNSGSQDSTNISKITGDILIKNGIAQTSNLQALLDLGNVGATGTADLAAETLNLHVTAVLSKASTQQAGGTSVGGFMQTALANSQGELVIPAIVTGTFQNPKFTPDVNQIAQMKLKGLVPNFDNPASAASSLLGGLLGKKTGAQPDQQQQQQDQQQQNPVNQILGLFGKKKK